MKCSVHVYCFSIDLSLYRQYLLYVFGRLAVEYIHILIVCVLDDLIPYSS